MDTSELEKIVELHRTGALTEEEFAQAKARLLSPDSGSSSLGRAANRGVTLLSVWMVIGLVVVLAFFFGFFLPAWNNQQVKFEQRQSDFHERWNNMSRKFGSSANGMPGQASNEGLAAKQ